MQISTSTGVVQAIGFVLGLSAVVATDGYATDHLYRKSLPADNRNARRPWFRVPRFRW